MTRRLVAVLILGLTAVDGFAYPPPPKDTKPDADKLAKDLGEAFLAHVTKTDFEAVLKTVDFPYLTVGGKVLDKADGVKRDLRDIVSALWTEETTVAVKEVVSPEKFETWASALPVKPEAYKTEVARKAVLDTIGPSGRIVALQFEIDGKKDDDLCLLLVRIKDGKAVLAGLLD